MIDGAAQSATNGSELLLIQMVRKFNHHETGVPTYEWCGPLEHKAFWSVLRNAERQNKEYCQGYVWKRLHDDNHIPTLKTDVPQEQQTEFYGEHDIRVLKDGRILHTRLPTRDTRPPARDKSQSSWYSWRNPNQKWFGGGKGSNRKPVSPKAKRAPTSGARGSQEQAPEEQAPVINVDDVEPQAEPPAADANEHVTDELEQAAQAIVEQALDAPIEPTVPVETPQADDPAHRPTQISLQQSFNMINESWQCLAQCTYGSQYAGAVLEQRVLTLEQASPKNMADIVKRITHVYDKLNENDTNLSGQLNILKEDVSLFIGQINDVKAAADNLMKKTIERMAIYETKQELHTEQIEAMKKQIKTLEDIIRLMYDALDKQTPGTSSEAAPVKSK
eukprot:4246943-Amphidinium_carterae.1